MILHVNLVRVCVFGAGTYLSDGDTNRRKVFRDGRDIIQIDYLRFWFRYL